MHYVDLLEEIKQASIEILGDDIVGIYVHGSLAFGCFNPVKSDIDYLVVIKKPMTLSQKIKYISATLEINKKAPEKGIEMSVVLENYCKSFVYPTPYDLHFSNTYLERAAEDTKSYCEEMNGVDSDLAAHFTVTRAVGYVIFGKPIDEVFSPVPKADYLDSIKSDIENALEDIFENPVYVILNLCRVLAYIKDGVVISKSDGGEWGIKNLPQGYHKIIENALGCYLSELDQAFEESREELSAFARNMLKSIFSDRMF